VRTRPPSHAATIWNERPECGRGLSAPTVAANEVAFSRGAEAPPTFTKLHERVGICDHKVAIKVVWASAQVSSGILGLKSKLLCHGRGLWRQGRHQSGLGFSPSLFADSWTEVQTTLLRATAALFFRRNAACLDGRRNKKSGRGAGAPRPLWNVNDARLTCRATPHRPCRPSSRKASASCRRSSTWPGRLRRCGSPDRRWPASCAPVRRRCGRRCRS